MVPIPVENASPVPITISVIPFGVGVAVGSCAANRW
jgi:hypothetical protein